MKTWQQQASLINKRAFGMLFEWQSTSSNDFQLFAVGGLDLQTYQHASEVEMYDLDTNKWKFHRNLPADVTGPGPNNGCVGSTRDLIIFVGEYIQVLNWQSWKSENITEVPSESRNTKCSGKIHQI